MSTISVLYEIICYEGLPNGVPCDSYALQTDHSRRASFHYEIRVISKYTIMRTPWGRPGLFHKSGKAVRLRRSDVTIPSV